jgi:hypothetical protein
MGNDIRGSRNPKALGALFPVPRLHQQHRERARNRPTGQPQRQEVAQRRDGAQMDRRRPHRGPEVLPPPQGLPSAPILRSTLQNHMQKAQTNSAIETIMKAA